MPKRRVFQRGKIILMLGIIAILTGCVADSHLWGLIPNSTDVCAHGRDSLTGNCRD